MTKVKGQASLPVCGSQPQGIGGNHGEILWCQSYTVCAKIIIKIITLNLPKYYGTDIKLDH